MLKLIKVDIKNFRSISSLSFNYDNLSNTLAIIGENNVGKTNCLRAISIFFNPEKYDETKDVSMFKNATGGGAKHPKISLSFYDDEKNETVTIIRNFNSYCKELELTGNLKGKKKKTEKLDPSEIKKIMSLFSFVFLESTNLKIPDLVNEISNNVLDKKYKSSRFSSKKIQIKTAYDEYVDGLQKNLNKFSEEISKTFMEFRKNWRVTFDIPRNSNTFKELITKDATLKMNDEETSDLTRKGSGMQWLGYLLLNFEYLARIEKKCIIVCIDEPDTYLHEKFQKQLLNKMKSTKSIQFLYASHSRIFIDFPESKSLVYLEAKEEEKYSKRKKKNFFLKKTSIVDVSTDSGWEKMKETLGIQSADEKPFRNNNIVVEGDVDVDYLSKLTKFYNIDCPKILQTGGAANMLNALNFYDSIRSDPDKKPKFNVIIDNDEEGRQAYKKISNKKFDNILVNAEYVPNFLNTDFSNAKGINIEIEDFIFPEIIFYIWNKILFDKNMNILKNKKKLVKEFCRKAYIKSGILKFIQEKTKSANPDCESDSLEIGPNFKKWIVQRFDPKNEREIRKIMEEYSAQNVFQKNYLLKITDFSDEKHK